MHSNKNQKWVPLRAMKTVIRNIHKTESILYFKTKNTRRRNKYLFSEKLKQSKRFQTVERVHLGPFVREASAYTTVYAVSCAVIYLWKISVKALIVADAADDVITLNEVFEEEKTFPCTICCCSVSFVFKKTLSAKRLLAVFDSPTTQWSVIQHRHRKHHTGFEI